MIRKVERNSVEKPDKFMALTGLNPRASDAEATL